MKITISPYKAIIKKYEKTLDEMTKQYLNNVVDYATKQAQNSFDRFAYEIPADDPIIDVFSTHIVKASSTSYSRTIEARGNQVLFAEFGAGKTYYTDVETRLYQSYVGNPRPSQVLDIGEYGQHRGKDDLWFYKSHTGRESENAHLVKYNRSGEPIMITHGNRPARALYRGVGMAIRRLLGGKLK